MKHTIDLPTPTPAQLAEAFWAMDDEQQGMFFDELGTLAMTHKCYFTGTIGSMFPLDQQMYHASRKCTPLGRDAMRRFSDSGVMLLAPNYEKPQP